MKRWLNYMALLLTAILLTSASGGEFVRQIQEALNTWYNRHVPVKLFVFRNQPAYMPGDTIFFRSSMMLAAGNRFIADRVIITVRLVSESGDVTAEQPVLLKNGTGDGYLLVPQATVAGVFFLEAFDRRMLKENPALCFRTEVVIGGKAVLPATSEPGFFAEGGAAVYGVPNKIVVLGPPGASGRISAADGKVLANYLCNNAGIGTFFLNPQRDVSYTLTTGKGVTSPLPITLSEGIALSASGFGNSKTIRVAVQRSPAAEAHKELHLVIWNQNELSYTAQFSLHDRSGVALQVPVDNLKPGLNGISLFTEQGLVLAERLFYLPGKGPEKVLTLEKEEYLVREKVRISLAPDNTLGQANVAVTVYQEDLFQSTDSDNNGQQYFSLAADLGISSSSLPRNADDINLYLITRRWKRFSWDELADDKPETVLPFDSKLALSGRALQRGTDKPVPDSTQLIFLLQRSLMNYETYVTRGEFDFPLLLDFFGEEKIVCQAFYKNQPVDVQLAPAAPIRLVTYSGGAEVQPDRYTTFVTDRRTVNASFGILPPPRHEYNWADEVMDFAGGADITIRLKDYLMFPTLAETIHEVIPDLKARKGRNGDFVRMTISDRNAEAMGDPVYIIDGVFCDNTAYFLSIKPENIEVIRLINTAAKLSKIGLVNNGIVVVETNLPSIRRKIPQVRTGMTMRGLNYRKVFALKQSVERRLRVPDLRANIYWNPQVKLNIDKPSILEFITPDNPGIYRVVVDGLTAQGKPIHEEKTFLVRFHK